MKKNGKYRFSLQFKMSSEDAIRAGELLENLGYKKSKVIITALNEYIRNHPEIKNGTFIENIPLQSIPMDIELLELKIRQLIEDHLNMNTSHTESKATLSPSVDSSSDIVEMLNDLDLFQ